MEENQPQIPTYYGSGVRVRTSPYDVSLLFSRALPVGTGAAEREETVCIVSISPALAKSMLRILERHIQNYEKRHSALPDIDVLQEKQEEGQEKKDG